MWQNGLLVVASYVFYGWVHPWFLLPFVATTLIDYSLARGIESRPHFGRTLLAASILSNLSLLGFFKYHNFFAENAAAALASIGWNVPLPVLNVVLPVGISFYTFQSIGYVVDVYRRQTPACHNLLDYMVFVSLFPQLVAGPITLITLIWRSPRRISGDAGTSRCPAGSATTYISRSAARTSARRGRWRIF